MFLWVSVLDVVFMCQCFSFFSLCLVVLWLELVGCYYRFVFYLFFIILGRDVHVRMNNLATAGAWENYYLVVVAVQGPPAQIIYILHT